MRTGDLRHRITLQELVSIPDGMGGFSEGWQDVATVWASVEPLRGQERYLAQQAVQEITHKVTIRYRKSVSPKMRILFGNRVLSIVAVIDPGERRKWLELLCLEVTS